MTDLLTARLRTETTQAHRALEQTLDILRPSLSRAQYLDTLQTLFGFLQPLEQRIRAHLPARLLGTFAPDYAERLAQDIVHLSGEEPPPAPGVLSFLPNIDSEAAALGSLYVLEGSMLGARIIGPHLAAKFALSAAAGCAYFGAGAAADSSRWPSFKALLNECVAPQDHEHAIAAARATFDGLRVWLSATEALA